MHRLLLGCLLLWLAGCSSEGDSSFVADPTPETPGNGRYALGGALLVAASTAIDSDLNDPNAPYVDNDSHLRAQALPNPVTLGGYVNEPNVGEAGRSRISGDYDDFYVLDLLAGQAITLLIGNADLVNNDLDLGLLDARDGSLLDASVSIGNTENLVVPADGRYLVQVQAFVGASNYVLSIGQNTALTEQLDTLRLSDEFVPGEVLVQTRDPAQSQAGRLSALGLRALGTDESRRQRYRIERPSTRHSLAIRQGTTPPRFANLKAASKYATLMTVKSLRRDPALALASPNYYWRAQQVPNDRLYYLQWHYPMLNLPQAWDITTGSASVVVAVIDTGVLLKHPDLQGKWVEGYDFISDPAISLDGDGLDSNPDDPGDDLLGGSSFHGTHVAGTIAALSNNGEGVAGIAWQTRIMPLRVLGKEGVGEDYDIEQAMRYAAGLPNDSGRVPAQRADIINVSLGGPSISPGWQALIDEVRRAGVIVVSAAGNDGTTAPSYPAALNGVVSVTAVDINKTHAEYANRGATVDVAAPGGGNGEDVNGDGAIDAIISTSGDDSSGGIQFIYGPNVGTSMATPHVAGVISLMKAVNPALTPADFDALLRAGHLTEDLGAVGRDDLYGYGLLNAHAAVLAALNLDVQQLPNASPIASINPSALNFGNLLEGLVVSLSNAGGGNLRVLSHNSDHPAVRISPRTVDADGIGQYLVQVERSGLSSGTYSAKLLFATNAGELRLSVIWQVGGEGYGDAGIMYLLVLDANTSEVVASRTLQSRQGRYPFSVDGLAAGSYTLIAGGDSDNNGFICDAGEACGAYLIPAKPTTLTLPGDLGVLEFSVNFNTTFLSLTTLSKAISPVP